MKGYKQIMNLYDRLYQAIAMSASIYKQAVEL